MNAPVTYPADLPAGKAGTVLSENHSPPEPWRSFAIRFRGFHGSRWHRHESTVDHLSSEELRWVSRVLAAELLRRERNGS